jgi:adenylosuccinate synthase
MRKTPLQASIVVDLGFGDSGKGITVDYLCSQSPDIKRTLVVRFDSGHQVGHTVQLDGFKHTFSNFGSGTLRGVPTYYSQNVTVFPPAILLEGRELSKYSPRLYFHPLTMIATPYDIAWNRVNERVQQHGSCGVGYGATIVRNKDGAGLSVKDLSNKWVFIEKCRGIVKYYFDKMEQGSDLEQAFLGELKNVYVQDFYDECMRASMYWETAFLRDIVDDYDTLVFEGNQGILLDRFEGIHPHNSWSSCTSEQALQLLQSDVEEQCQTSIYYVTRCYQTRHGNGPMSSSIDISLVNNEAEINVPNEWQGKMRVKDFDTSLISWSLETDKAHRERFGTLETHLVITCLDQRPDWAFETEGFAGEKGLSSVLGSFSPESKDFKELYHAKTRLERLSEKRLAKE